MAHCRQKIQYSPKDPSSCTEISNQVHDKFRERVGMDLLHFPGISGLYTSAVTRRILPQINDEITSWRYAEMALQQLQLLVYCSAVATVRLCANKDHVPVIDWLLEFTIENSFLNFGALINTARLGWLKSILVISACERISNIVRNIYRHMSPPFSVVYSRLRQYSQSQVKTRNQNTTCVRKQLTFLGHSMNLIKPYRQCSFW